MNLVQLLQGCLRHVHQRVAKKLRRLLAATSKSNKRFFTDILSQMMSQIDVITIPSTLRRTCQVEKSFPLNSTGEGALSIGLVDGNETKAPTLAVVLALTGSNRPSTSTSEKTVKPSQRANRRRRYPEKSCRFFAREPCAHCWS